MKSILLIPLIVVLAGLRTEADPSGPKHLTTLLAENETEIRSLRENKTRLDDPRHAELRNQIDSAAHQRDAFVSGLYCHTDIASAQAEAERTKKPILSLRLLGRLDEEYSCANSRFFRTVLYANEEVSKLLREQFVLHWKSVRPAPLLTIDMGDGRRIKRTITGNSIHYVLNSKGQVIDALPGIYSPDAFRIALSRSLLQARESQALKLHAWHGREAHQLCREWLSAAVRAGAYGDDVRKKIADFSEAEATLHSIVSTAFPSWKGDKSAILQISPQQCRARFESVNPRELSRTVDRLLWDGVTVTVPKFQPRKTSVPFEPPSEFDVAKAMVERPVMRQALPGPANTALDPASPEKPSTSLAGRMTSKLWAEIATPFRSSVRLDESSRRLMIQKLPEDAIRPEEWKSGAPANDNTAFGRLLRRFEESIARDMVRNEFYYHTQIHQWLEEDKDGKLASDVEALNRRVYDELFLTPDYDAWLGLVPEDTYTALEKDGCACEAGAPPMRRSGSQ